MDDILHKFRMAMEARNIIPPSHLIADGKIHRCDVEGKNGKNDGAYILYSGYPQAGGFENWQDGQGWENWSVKVERNFSVEEKNEYYRKLEKSRLEREAEEVKRHSEAKITSGEIWKNSPLCPDDGHPYLIHKKIKACGVKVKGGYLAIPLRDIDDELQGIQFINSTGNKWFLSGTQKKGHYFLIGKPAEVICVTEGFATAASIYEATEYAIAVAFDCGNLLSVANVLREKFPNLQIIICADDDYQTQGNPGLTKAQEAAQAIDACLAVPDFGTDRSEGFTDFNDLAQARGLEIVKKCIENARSNTSKLSKNNSVKGLSFRLASNIKAKPIRWLWKGKIARGKVIILAGHPGLGKSQATASIAAIVSIGGLWPVDRTHCEQAKVVFLSAEDDAADTIRPRLEASGADLSQVVIIDADPVLDKNNTRRSFNLKTDILRLGIMLEELGNVGLVVIDPITAYLGETESHKNAEIRALLAPLSDLAAKYGAAILCVSHLNKNSGSDPLMRVTGSLAFVAAARAAFLITKDSENPTRRLFLPLKNNVGNDQSGLAFSIQSKEVKSQEENIETSCVIWESQVVTITADQAMSAGNSNEVTTIDEATVWLRDLLKDESTGVNRRDIMKAAEAMGFKERTIYHAKRNLGVKVTQFGFGKEKNSRWSLDESINSDKDSQSRHTRQDNKHGKHDKSGENTEIYREVSEIDLIPPPLDESNWRPLDEI